jgi:hypothetical protein
MNLLWNCPYTLDENDQRLISLAARQIRDLNEARRTVSKHWTDDTQIELDRQHAGAVIAFCRLAQVEPILVRGEWTNGEGKVHCYLPDGRSVSVKQTPRRRGQLLIEEDEPKVAALYALMVGISPTYAFRGWEVNARVFVSENLTWGYRCNGKPPSQRYHLRQYLFAGVGGRGFLQRDLVAAR